MNWGKYSWYHRILVFAFVIIFILGLPYWAFNKFYIKDDYNNKYKTSSTCPKGIIPAFLNNGLKPSIEVSCKQVDEFQYKNKIAKILQVTYGSKLNIDYVEPVSIAVTVLPSGEITFDKKYLNLKNDAISSATTYVLRKFNQPPIKSEFLQLRGGIKGPNNNGEYCGIFDLKIPFDGVITTCGELGGPFYSEGGVNWDSKVPTVEDLFNKASNFASSTYPWKSFESIYGVSPEQHKYTLKSLNYDSSGNFWVVILNNGYINSLRFIKIENNGQISCMTSCGNLGSVCP